MPPAFRHVAVCAPEDLFSNDTALLVVPHFRGPCACQIVNRGGMFTDAATRAESRYRRMTPVRQSVRRNFRMVLSPCRMAKYEARIQAVRSFESRAKASWLARRLRLGLSRIPVREDYLH